MNNYSKVFRAFKKNYKPVPLEVFHSNPYKALVSTIMSARTRDETTLRIAHKLFEVAPDVKKLNQLTETQIKNLIRGVGFYNTKAKYIKETSEIILKDFKGKVPNTREKLMSLPGVGRKTANLVLNRAFNIPAIAVDTHVHKISNLLEWVKTNSPGKTEIKLMEVLPKKYWTDMNNLFVSIGQQYRSKKKLVDFLKANKLINSQE
ncbi:endonuclease III [Candidatus Woesebacteria bacterium]|nr:endonuclease III [Candidatus Woesebacteria bacterium]